MKWGQNFYCWWKEIKTPAEMVVKVWGKKEDGEVEAGRKWIY